MFIMFLIGCMSFSAFLVDINEVGDRQACILTLVLTTVAFKYVTMEMMPEIPYLTILDKVMYGCMVLQAAMLVVISMSANLYKKDVTTAVIFDYYAASAMTTLWILLNTWFLYRVYILTSERENYLKDCNEKFERSIGRNSTKLKK